MQPQQTTRLNINQTHLALDRGKLRQVNHNAPQRRRRVRAAVGLQNCKDHALALEGPQRAAAVGGAGRLFCECSKRLSEGAAAWRCLLAAGQYQLITAASCSGTMLFLTPTCKTWLWTQCAHRYTPLPGPLLPIHFRQRQLYSLNTARTLYSVDLKLMRSLKRTTVGAPAPPPPVGTGSTDAVAPRRRLPRCHPMAIAWGCAVERAQRALSSCGQARSAAAAECVAAGLRRSPAQRMHDCAPAPLRRPV